MDKPNSSTQARHDDDASGPCAVHLSSLNLIRFVLPSMPVSVNGIYQVIFSERRVELKPAARTWKTKAKEHMPPWKPSPGASIKIDAHFEFPRHHKNGSLRVKDVSNYLKLLIDAIAERYSFGDHVVTHGSWSCSDSPTERVIVTVSEIGDMPKCQD